MQKNTLRIAAVLVRFIEDEVLPGTGLDLAAFWSGVSAIFERFSPENAELLAMRDQFQEKINRWHAAHKESPVNQSDYENFLCEIGYLLPDPEPFSIDPTGVDAEVASTAGAQLVVPIQRLHDALKESAVGPSVKNEFIRQGFVVVPGVLDHVRCELLTSLVQSHAASGAESRQLLEQAWCALADELRRRPVLHDVLHINGLAVQCTLFDKSPTKNWLVSLHQDLSIPVRARVAAGSARSGRRHLSQTPNVHAHVFDR